MDDAQLLRYSRHILLPELGIDAQERFAAAHALIVGAGGLGSAGGAVPGRRRRRHAHALRRRHGRPHQPAAADPLRDRRRRQRRRSPRRRRRLHAINPEVRVETVRGARRRRPSSRRWSRAPTSSLDCCDNFATRHAVNRACVAARKPLVSGAAIRFDGQIAVFDPRDPASPCYHCLFGEGEEIEETRCATMGVFAPLVGIIGATQAAEALKLIAGVGETITGRLLLLDALSMRWRDVRIARDPACPVCGGCEAS